MRNRFIFQVHSKQSSSDLIRIEGRCCEGYIQVGDVFTEVQIRTQPDAPQLSKVRTQPVEYKIVEIFSWGEDDLAVGETGALAVPGSNFALLSKHCLLIGYSDSTTVPPHRES